MTDTSHFPKEFLWGAATSSYQVEGGIENCDWAQAALTGNVPECGIACDHYHRYEEDFDIAKELRHNAHRFSIEWARIEPEEGKFDEDAIEHYRQVLRALHARGLKPMITLWHFTLPLWFSSSGGWERGDAPDIFARYCDHVVTQLGDLADHYATINEPMVVAGMGYLRGVWPPFRKRALVQYLRVLLHMTQGHNRAYEVIKRKYVRKEVGIVKHTVAFMGTGSPLNHLRAWVSNLAWTRLFMGRVSAHTDWIGLNYYNRKVYGDARSMDKTDMGWNIDPLGIEDALRILWRYRRPVYIAEAGCADAHDRFRADYIRDTVRGIGNALKEGVDVRGYCYWSLLDNYELAEGFPKRFGLVEVNYDTLERRIRPSAYVYKELIERNGLVE